MKKLFYLILLSPVLVLSQSTDQNYIKKTIYKTPTVNALPSPNPGQAAVNITYFDGLGRPIQQNAHKQSATGKDIITHIEYDEFGRQVKEFLPYVTTAANPNFRTDAPTRVVSYYQSEYNDEYPFSEKEFENSPLNRVLRQGAPGAVWQLNQNHTIDFDYKTNTENEVKRFKATISGISNGVYTATLGNSSGNVYYNANELYKTVVTDENRAKTEEFKDKEGRVVLKRTYNVKNPQTSNRHDTYYVYDMYGNLTYVIPPKAVDLGAITSAVLNNLCYQYRYDSRNRLAEKKVPGRGNPTHDQNSGWEYIVYDKLDRVIATGPALSPFEGSSATGWLITKYDVFGRVVYTGWNTINNATSSGNRNSLQTAANAATVFSESRQATNRIINGVSFRYTNSAYPTTTNNFHILTVNYYDDYQYNNPPTTTPTIVEGQEVTTQLKNLITGSWVRIPTITGETLHEMTQTFYDKKARPIRIYKKNHLGGFTQTDTKLDFIGNTEYTLTKHKRIIGDTELTVREDFEYTPQGRLLEHKHKLNNLTTETLSHNVYDELGQLDIKKVGRNATTPLQTVNYNYNIRGWLTDINDVDTLGDDLFAFKINYDVSYHTTPSPLYNGNISETYWRTSTDNTLRKYVYGYDAMNRMHSAFYSKPVSSGTVTQGTFSYTEQTAYDKNGNITTIIRMGDFDNDLDYIVIDLLGYTYDAGNRLKKVEDTSNHPEGFTDGANNNDEYGYDIFGNMVRDDNKGITGITYNHLNLPKEITFENSSTKKISYLYNALGQKVRKVITNGTEITTTDYQGGFHYENNGLKFIATAEGYVNNASSGGGNQTRQGFSYVYNYTDHLGNIRLSYTRGSGTNPPVILEENHYYPFGLKHKKYGSVDKDLVCVDEDCYEIGIDVVPPQARKTYQYKYNGKEFQDELNLNLYDFSARLYDPAIGRTPIQDPLAENYYSFSPYSFLNNNPIRYVDPDGRMAVDFDDVIITGDKSQEAFNQLQSSTSLKLKMDGNGKVTASGKAKTDADKKLLEATTDANVVVQVNATSSNFTESGHWYIGGAYGGSTVGADGKTYTTQTVNPEMTGKIDEFYGMKNGVSVMHEVIESYIGGVESPGVGAPTFDNTTPEFKAYKNAHDKTEAIDPRHRGLNISQDPNTGHLYINKPHPVIPQLNVELLINDLSKKK